MNAVVKRRNWKFEKTNGTWRINGKIWDPEIDHEPGATSTTRRSR